MLFLVFFTYFYLSLLSLSVAFDTSYHLNEDQSTAMLYYQISSLSSGNIISLSSVNRTNTNYYTALQMQIIGPSGFIINSTTIKPNSACPYFIHEKQISVNSLPNQTFQIYWMCANLPNFPVTVSTMIAIYREDFSLIAFVSIEQNTYDLPGEPAGQLFLTTQSNIVFKKYDTCFTGTTQTCYTSISIYSGLNGSLISQSYAFLDYTTNYYVPNIAKQYANGENIFEIWFEYIPTNFTTTPIQNNSLYLSFFFDSYSLQKKVLVTNKYTSFSVLSWYYDAVVLTNQNILVVWSDEQTASCSFRLFNQNGDPITSEKSFYNNFRVIYKAIAMPAGKFAIVIGITLFKLFDEAGMELAFTQVANTVPAAVIPLQSGSFFMIFDSYVSNTGRVCQYFNSQGEPIYCLASCPSPKVISDDKKSCSQFVQDCSNYSNNLCQSCIYPKVLTIGRIFCANPINNCLTYADNGKCITCSSTTRLTIGAIACADPLANCSVYSDNLLCLSCIPPNVLIVAAGQSKCATPIPNCLNYSIDGLCSMCNSGYLVSNYRFHCISIYCAVFRSDDRCDSCTLPKTVTEGNLECADPIEKCSSYSEDKKCLSCNNNTILTSGKTACATPISNCSSYSDDAKCDSCQASKLSFLSADKKACSSLISDCKNYSDDGLCISCLFGSNLSDDKKKCIKQPIKTWDYNKTLSSKISLNISNSTAQKFVLKKNQLNFELGFNSDRIFKLDVPNLNFELYNDTHTLQIYVFNYSNGGNNKIRFSCNLSNYPTSYYSFRMLLYATSSSRILQENVQDLPSNFTFTYETKEPIYLGMSEEIAAEIQRINTVVQEDLGVSSPISFAFVLIIFGPILLIFVLAFLWCWYSYRKKKKVYYNAPTEAVTPQVSEQEAKIKDLKEGNLVVEDL